MLASLCSVDTVFALQQKWLKTCQEMKWNSLLRKIWGMMWEWSRPCCHISFKTRSWEWFETRHGASQLTIVTTAAFLNLPPDGAAVAAVAAAKLANRWHSCRIPCKTPGFAAESQFRVDTNQMIYNLHLNWFNKARSIWKLCELKLTKTVSDSLDT